MSGKKGNKVPVAPLREFFLRNKIDPGEVAERMGWTRRHKTPLDGFIVVPDTTRVRRDLGLTAYDRGKGTGSAPKVRISYDKAVKLAQAMGADPVDVGL